MPSSTAEAIGEEFGITERSVRRAEKYSKGIDALKEVSADAADKVLKGQSKATKAAIRDLPGKDAEEIADIAEAIERGEPVPVKETPAGQGGPSQSVKSLVDEIIHSETACIFLGSEMNCSIGFRQKETSFTVVNPL